MIETLKMSLLWSVVKNVKLLPMEFVPSMRIAGRPPSVVFVNRMPGVSVTFASFSSCHRSIVRPFGFMPR